MGKYRPSLLDVLVFICTDALVCLVNGRGDPKTLFHNKIKENGKEYINAALRVLI
jgi:hypothetical protein